MDKPSKLKIDSLVTAMCILVTVTTIITHTTENKIASEINYVDIQELLQFIRVSKIKNDDLSSSNDLNYLMKFIQKFAVSQNIIIFTKTSLVAGGNDLTNEIKNLLKNEKI